jgi:membrane protein implicated in regulation of membrane protease activity
MSIFWILTFVPTFVFNLALIVGVLGLLVAAVAGRVPFISQYKLPIQLLAFALTIVAVFFQGALAYKNSVAVEVAELKLRLQKAETKSVETNVEIVEKIVTDTQVIREKGQTITEYVDREVSVYNDRCILPKEVINAHNMAATLKLDEDTTEEQPK